MSGGRYGVPANFVIVIIIQLLFGPRSPNRESRSALARITRLYRRKTGRALCASTSKLDRTIASESRSRVHFCYCY